jgi:hypothetical protein
LYIDIEPRAVMHMFQCLALSGRHSAVQPPRWRAWDFMRCFDLDNIDLDAEVRWLHEMEISLTDQVVPTALGRLSRNSTQCGG